jgi:hypothetical protein
VEYGSIDRNVRIVPKHHACSHLNTNPQERGPAEFFRRRI